MKRLSMTAVVFAALLAVAAPAHAKGLVSASVCGAEGCREVRDTRQIMFFADDGAPVDPPGSASAWYRVRLTMGEEGHPENQHRTEAAVVLDQRLFRGDDGTWFRLSEGGAREYRAAAAGLEPLPVSELGLDVGVPQRLPGAGDSDGGAPWPLVAGGIVALLAALALVPVTRRRLGARPSSS